MRQRSILTFVLRSSSCRGLGLALALSGLAPACVDDGGEEGGGGAAATEIRSCKESCDQLKFFDCNDAADHAACFAACEQASSSAIELFVSCVRTDICDPACVDDLVQDAGPPSGGEGGGGGGGSCVDACNALVADGCVEPVDCGAACAMVPESAHAFVAYCVERRDGCQLPEECDAVLEDDPEADCEDACGSMLFFDCIDAQQHSDCRSLCGSVDEDARDTFTACAGDGICSDASCYDVLGGGEEGGGAEGGGDGGSLQPLCEAGCDDMMFWECIDATAHASCRSHCAEADDSSVSTFLGCLGVDPTVGGIGTCEDSACYDVFVG